MAKTWTLRFASFNYPDDIFECVVNGSKTIETRPNTKDFKVGDKLVLVSMHSKRSIKKIIKSVHIYKSVAQMVEYEPEEKIYPGIGTKTSLVEFYEQAALKWGKNYKDDLEKYGIIALEIK